MRIRKGFSIISNGLKTVPDGLPSALLVNLLGSSIFSMIGSLCHGFKIVPIEKIYLPMPVYWGREQGLRYIAEMEQPFGKLLLFVKYMGTVLTFKVSKLLIFVLCVTDIY